ncbi:thiamine-triphosphatase [Trichomycterus rosablanca]|uniref:thiamine-triphosphatase n=1 Tax=Trichomycterus rosablanca TaxID=2290929 RepID=UPI002F35C39F
MQVEVERKFVCDSDIQQKLQQIGAVCLGQREFRDQYFDSDDFTLTLRDFWLRKRDASWELKRPSASRRSVERSSERLCTNYRELTDPREIKAELTEVMRTESCADDEEFESWLQRLTLKCFAEFTTVRRSYALGDEGDGTRVRVDLDQADFGYCVGEIEVLVSDGEDTTLAMRRIEEAALKLGLAGEKKVQGKMEVYLKRFHPHHYTQLLDAHVL